MTTREEVEKAVQDLRYGIIYYEPGEVSLQTEHVMDIAADLLERLLAERDECKRQAEVAREGLEYYERHWPSVAEHARDTLARMTPPAESKEQA